LLLDLLIFGVAAWLLGSGLRRLAFKGKPAPAWLAWLSATAIFAFAFVAIYWGQQESFRLYMESLFGPNYRGRPFQPQPPIFTSFAIASVWFASLRGHLRFPSFRRRPAAPSSRPATVPDAAADPLWTPPTSSAVASPANKRTIPPFLFFGAGAVAAIAVLVVANPSVLSGVGLGQQSQEACFAERGGRAANEAQLVAARTYCNQLPTDVELRCNSRVDPNYISVEGTLFQNNYGLWRLEVYSEDSRREFGRFTINVRFTDNSTRNYDVTMSERVRPREVVSGYFEAINADRYKRVRNFAFVAASACN
jgi:hypothetical protein